MMSKQNYIAAAAVIKHSVDAREEEPDFYPDGAGMEAIMEVAKGLASMFGADNSRFDRARFLTACGLSGMVGL